MIEIFVTCQTKSIAKQMNRDESLIIRSIGQRCFYIHTLPLGLYITLPLGFMYTAPRILYITAPRIYVHCPLDLCTLPLGFNITLLLGFMYTAPRIYVHCP